MSESIIREKSFKFAVKIVNLYKELSINNREYVLSKQLLRSGTSIGANVKEALRGQTKRDFSSKMNIALKEADETEYWIELLIETSYLKIDIGNDILAQCKELSKILNSIVKTTQNSLITKDL